MADEDIRWRQRLSSFQRALVQLRSAVQLRNARGLSELEQQGLIQAFEFTHELAWNVMRDYLRAMGREGLVASRDATRAAFAAGLVTQGEPWMEMIASRNLSSHTYNSGAANALAARICDVYAALFEAFATRMQGLADGATG
jgi:nucleotidyltransferase substrate binding protein (TIGR01987 family)